MHRWRWVAVVNHSKLGGSQLRPQGRTCWHGFLGQPLSVCTLHSRGNLNIKLYGCGQRLFVYMDTVHDRSACLFFLCGPVHWLSVIRTPRCWPGFPQGHCNYGRSQAFLPGASLETIQEGGHVKWQNRKRARSRRVTRSKLRLECA